MRATSWLTTLRLELGYALRSRRDRALVALRYWTDLLTAVQSSRGLHARTYLSGRLVGELTTEDIARRVA